MANNIKGITIEIGGNTTKLDQALKNVNSTTKTLKNELKEIDKALKLDPKNTELLAQKQKVLAESIQATNEKLKTLKEAEEQARKAFEAGELPEEKFRALQREIVNTENELKNLTAEAEKSKLTLEKIGQGLQNAGEKITKFGDGMQTAGQKLMPVTTAITGVGVASIKAATDFEDAMAKLNTIADTSEKTGVPLEELEKQIKSLSDQTGISASEIADNVYNAISAGQKTGDAVNFVAQSTKLAAAGFADSGQALDLLTTILNAYGMEAEEVNHVSDVLINTQNLGKTTVGELASAMGKVIPTANSANVSLENLAAGYSIMTANGIATAESTTYMNSMLNELSKSGTKASDTIKDKTGKSFQDLMKDGASLADVLSILQESAEENGLAMGDMFGSAEAGKAALTLLSGGAEQFNDTLKSMNEATGTTEEAFGKLDTTSRKAKIALNQIKNSAIELGGTILDMVMPYFEQFVQKIKDVTTWFNNLDESQKKMIVKIGAIVAAIGPALIVGGKITSTVGKIVSGVGGLITKIGSLSGAAGGLSGALGALASPVGIVIAAIAALAAGFVYLYKTNDEFRDKVNATVEKVKKSFSDMVQKVKPLLQNLKAAFDNLMKALQPIFELLLTYIASFVNGIINAAGPIISAVTNVVNYITNIIQAFISLFSGDVDGFVEHIKAAFQNAVDFVKNILTAWGQFFVGFFEGFGIDIPAIFSNIFTAITTTFQNIGAWFTEKFTAARTGIETAFKNIGQWFADRWTDIKNALSTVATWYLTMWQNAYNNVVNVWKAIGQWFAARWTDIKNALSTVATWFLTMFQNAYNNVVNVWKAIGQWFAARWTDIKTALSTVATWFQTMFQNAYNNVVNVWKAIGSWFAARYTDIKNAIAGIPEMFRSTFQSAYDKVTGIFSKIGDWFKSNVIDKIKSLFDNFSLADAGTRIMNSFVNAIKSVHLPSLSVSWSEIEKSIGDVTIKIPVPHITWNALGGIFTNPAIFGMANGRLQGVGEAGPEAVLPLDTFYRNVEDYINDAVSRTAAAVAGQQAKGSGDFIQNNNYYSPKAIDAVEAARQTRIATRNMVMRLQGGNA